MLRRYTTFDYVEVQKWADARKFPLVPQEYLPVTGYIHEGYCAGFLYKTDSAIAWLEWVISNPNTEPSARDTALNETILALIEEARGLGFKTIFTSVEHKGLIDRYKQLGLTPTDKGMTNMVGRLV